MKMAWYELLLDLIGQAVSELRIFEKYIFFIFLNFLNGKSVNFSRRESVQLLTDAQLSYYGTQTKQKSRSDHSITSYLGKFAKNPFSSDFLMVFRN